MIRKCRWCRKPYNTRTESSIWCESNPYRGRGANRCKPSIVTLGPVLVLKPSPFHTG